MDNGTERSVMMFNRVIPGISCPECGASVALKKN